MPSRESNRIPVQGDKEERRIRELTGKPLLHAGSDGLAFVRYPVSRQVGNEPDEGVPIRFRKVREHRTVEDPQGGVRWGRGRERRQPRESI